MEQLLLHRALFLSYWLRGIICCSTSLPEIIVFSTTSSSTEMHVGRCRYWYLLLYGIESHQTQQSNYRNTIELDGATTLLATGLLVVLKAPKEIRRQLRPLVICRSAASKHTTFIPSFISIVLSSIQLFDCQVFSGFLQGKEDSHHRTPCCCCCCVSKIRWQKTCEVQICSFAPRNNINQNEPTDRYSGRSGSLLQKEG